MTPGLPHHRRGPRIDERRTDPADRDAIALAVVIAYVLSVLALVGFAFGVIR